MIIVVIQSTAFQLLHPFDFERIIVCYTSEEMVVLERLSEQIGQSVTVEVNREGDLGGKSTVEDSVRYDLIGNPDLLETIF